MRDIILGDADRGYVVHYDSRDAFPKFSCYDAASEVRSHFIDSIYQALKSLDAKKLMIKQNEKIELVITIQKEKVELKY